MKCVYVPPTLLKAMRGSGFEGRDYLDVNKLLSILSPEDLSFYLYLNLNQAVALPQPMVDTFANALIYGGITTVEAQQQETAAVQTPWDAITDERTRRDVSRLVNDYCVSEHGLPDDVADMELTSEIHVVTGGQILLFTHTPVPSDDTRTSAEKNKALYHRVLTQLSQFESVEELAKHSVFAGYLKASELKINETV